MIVSFNMLYSVYTCLGAIVNNLVAPFGYTSKDSSIFGVAFILSGLISSAVVSGYLDKTNKYLKTMKVLCFGTLICSACMLITLPSKNVWLLTINISVVGIFILPIIPTCYNFGTELTYPVSEAMTNGFMLFFSQILGTGMTFGATILSNYKPERMYTVILLLIMMTISCIASIFVKEDLRRLNLTKQI